MRKRLEVMFFICSLFLMLVFQVHTVEAASSILPTAYDNLMIGLKSTSELVATNNGYMRVFYDGEKIGIEYYDDDFQIQSKKWLDMELSIWGGFYAGSDAYYLVEGQNNIDENNIAEVLRVIKYDTDWNKKGTAVITSNTDLFGGEVRYPFDYGCVEMTEQNGILYIVTGHEGYVDASVKQGHQGFLMIAVDEASMTGKIVASDLWHSFAQYIACKDLNLYILEQSEGSRYTKLSKYNTENLEKSSLTVLEYGGSRTSAWAIPCYASVDGMALSSDNVLCIGTSIDQSKYDIVSSDTAHNIYLTVTPMSNFSKDATIVKWLTNYSGGGKCFLGVKITKINDNRFMISWEEAEADNTLVDTDDSLSVSTLHYIFIDGEGNKISQEFTQAIPISDCQPIVKGSKIVYYASNANMVDFYSIDAQTGELSKKVYRVAGENATWKLDGDVLTISGIGAISINTEANYRYPISSVYGLYSYSSSDNVWKSISEKVKKIVIKKGITLIPESAFEYFDNLTEVEIEFGVESIGKKAFYNCNALKKITIPSSVTSIGEDFLWTGAYWTHDDSHVVYAAICTPNNSYAMKYAEENNIRYYNSEDISNNDNTRDNQDKADNNNGNTGNNQEIEDNNGNTGDNQETTNNNNGNTGDNQETVDNNNENTGDNQEIEDNNNENTGDNQGTVDNSNENSGDNNNTTSKDKKVLCYITYKLKSGKNNPENLNFYEQGENVQLQPACRKGYKFVGWYTDKSCKNKVNNIVIEEDTTLYVKWEEIVVKTPTIKSLKALGNKKLKFSFKKDKTLDGYQIVYSKDMKFKNKQTKLINNETTYTLSNLESGKYAVKVRGYIIDSAGKKVYSKYTKAKNINIK